MSRFKVLEHNANNVYCSMLRFIGWLYKCTRILCELEIWTWYFKNIISIVFGREYPARIVLPLYIIHFFIIIFSVCLHRYNHSLRFCILNKIVSRNFLFYNVLLKLCSRSVYERAWTVLWRENHTSGFLHTCRRFDKTFIVWHFDSLSRLREFLWVLAMFTSKHL